MMTIISLLPRKICSIVMLFIFSFTNLLGLINCDEEVLFSASSSSLRRRLEKHAHLPMKPGYMVALIIAVFVGPWCLWITCFLFRTSSHSYEAKLQKLLERKLNSENAMKEAADALIKAK